MGGVEGVSRAIHDFRAEHSERVRGLKQGRALGRGPNGSWLEGAGFEPALTFEGGKRGFVFKSGESGIGYYPDTPMVWHGRVAAAAGTSRPLDLLQGDFFEVTPELIA